MITDAIINVLLIVPYLLLQGISKLDISLSFPEDVFSSFKSMVTCLDYVLPIGTFLLCLGVKIAVRVWSIPYAVLLKAKSFIPFMSD